ncbi:MAG: GH25 family lysozyme [Sandaracinus sp.]
MRSRSLAILSALVVLALSAGCQPAGLAARDQEGASRERSVRAPTLGVDISVWSGRGTDAEMECFWDHGVRHVVVGTQEPGIATQQMEMAINHGMSVDAYVYLVWSRDVRAQVRDAIAFASRYPVGILWLDMEDDPGSLGAGALEDRVAQAAEACGDYPCGVYTGGWWWNEHMGRSEVVTDLPLWYAYYDHDPSLATYPSQRVGAWGTPWAKQFDGDLRLCGIDVDLDTIPVMVPASRPHVGLPAAAPGVPAAPTNLSPTGYERVASWLDVRVMSDSVPGATSYELAVEAWNGTRYATYYTYTSTTSARSFSPSISDTTYRFRVRATNGAGTGAWSSWSYFQRGAVSGRPPEPGASPSDPAPSDPAPSDPAPSDPAPSDPAPSDPAPSDPAPSDPAPSDPAGLGAPSPADGARVTGASITMTRGALSGSHTYAFEIQYGAATGWAHYYDYAGSASSRTFWPAYASTAYRWRVAVDGGAPSAWATVLFGAGAVAPGTSDPAPSDPVPSDPAPSDPAPSDPAPAGAPTNLSPSGGTVTTDAVTLRCDPVASATSYELAIEVASGASFVPYYTYTSSTPSKTFYPATHATTYRFRVRARTSAGWSPWSTSATFGYR